jgi:hypothetical protein
VSSQVGVPFAGVVAYVLGPATTRAFEGGVPGVRSDSGFTPVGVRRRNRVDRSTC